MLHSGLTYNAAVIQFVFDGQVVLADVLHLGVEARVQRNLLNHRLLEDVADVAPLLQQVCVVGLRRRRRDVPRRLVQWARCEPLLPVAWDFATVILFVQGPMNIRWNVNFVAHRADLLPFDLVPIFQAVEPGIFGDSRSSHLDRDEVFVRVVLARRWAVRAKLG